MRKLPPPDPDNMNNDRAEWAAAALRHFQCTTGTDYEDALADLLGDLMHWCDRDNFDFEAALFRARGHYRAETGGIDRLQQHPLRVAVEKLLPHAEAEQERLYKLTLKYPSRDPSGYEDCRHAVSFAYEAIAGHRA
jgi:hypothetical protein